LSVGLRRVVSKFHNTDPQTLRPDQTHGQNPYMSRLNRHVYYQTVTNSTDLLDTRADPTVRVVEFGLKLLCPPDEIAYRAYVTSVDLNRRLFLRCLRMNVTKMLSRSPMDWNMTRLRGMPVNA